MAKNITVTVGSCADLAQLINENISSGSATPDVECPTCEARKNCKFVTRKWKNGQSLVLNSNDENQCKYALGMVDGYKIKTPVLANTYLQTNAKGDESMIINVILGKQTKEDIYDKVMEKLAGREI